VVVEAGVKPTRCKIKTMKLEIKTMKSGQNGFWDLRNQLNDFVKENFALLYEGAIRLEKNIPEDYYAPERVQINETRLHAETGLKYADGHKHDEDSPPTEKQLRQTIADIQLLIDEASKEIKPPFTLVVKENN
jgi:hypothetical protein